MVGVDAPGSRLEILAQIARIWLRTPGSIFDGYAR